jgi:hypothetical protein
MSFYCKNCNNSSLIQPFEGDICDDCWEIKAGSSDDWLVNWEKETEDGTPYYDKQIVSIPKRITENAGIDGENITNFLSDKYGWLVESLTPLRK